jgi:hypothetical protein
MEGMRREKLSLFGIGDRLELVANLLDYFWGPVSAARILDFTSSITSTTGAPENSGKGSSSVQ